MSQGSNAYFFKPCTFTAGQSVSETIDLFDTNGGILGPTGLAIDIPNGWTAADIGIDIAQYADPYDPESLTWLPLTGADGDAGARIKLTNVPTGRAVTAWFPVGLWAIGGRRYMRLVSLSTSNELNAVNQVAERTLKLNFLS